MPAEEGGTASGRFGDEPGASGEEVLKRPRHCSFDKAAAPACSAGARRAPRRSSHHAAMEACAQARHQAAARHGGPFEPIRTSAAMTVTSQEGVDSPWGRLSNRVMNGQLRGLHDSREWKSLSGRLLPGRMDRGVSATSLLRPRSRPAEELDALLSEEDARLALLATALQSRSLYLFHADHPLRKRCVCLVRSRKFALLVTSIVFLNCIFLAVRQPLEPEDSFANTMSAQAEKVFTVLFTMEFLVSVVTYGFALHTGSYLRSGWNVLDFVIVSLSWLSFFPSRSSSTLSLRTVRLLKPLRTISTNRSMRTLVTALVNCIPMLCNVFLLWMLVFVVFGILGMQLWMGAFHYCCTDLVSGARIVDDVTGEARLCGARTCPEGYTCASRNPLTQDFWPNPHFGVTSFDNYGLAMVSLFQVMTMEGWIDVNFMTWDVFSAWAVVYWLALILFCSYFIVSLATAVVYCNFSKAEDDETAAGLRKELEANGIDNSYKMRHTHAVNGDDTPTTPQSPSGVSKGMEWSDPETPAQQREISVHGEIFSQGPVVESFNQVQPSHANSPTAAKTNGSSDEPRHESQLQQVSCSACEAHTKTLPTSETPSFMSRLEHVPGFQPFRRVALFAELVINHAYFDIFVMVAILFNTVCLAIDHHNMSEDLQTFLESSNKGFLAVFVAEMVLKLLGLGIVKYFSDSFNTFDFVIVLVSLVELVNVQGFDAGGVSALRAFRLMRIVKLIRRWKSIQQVVRVVLASLPAITNFCCVLFIVMFAFALLGMEFFGDNMYEFEGCELHDGSEAYLTDVQGIELIPANGTQLREDCASVGGRWKRSLSRANFKNIYWACLTVFQLISAENWHLVMFLGVKNTSSVAVVYFLAVLLVGHYVLLNLFLAAIMKNMEVMTAEEIDTEIKVEAERKQRLSLARQTTINEGESRSPSLSRPSSLVKRLHSIVGEALRNVSKTRLGPQGAQQDSYRAWLRWRKEHSMWLFSPESRIRASCTRLTSHSQFEKVVIAAIVCSCVLLALENPHNEGQGPLGIGTRYLDIIFTVFFVVEVLMKIASLTFVEYIKDPWNRLDGLIATTSFLSILLYMGMGAIWLLGSMGAMSSNSSVGALGSLRSLKSLKALRVLRPLRLLSHHVEMQLVVMALVKSLPAVGNILFFLLLEWFIIAILGVQLFKGKFYLCTGDDAVTTLDGEIKCEISGSASNFDNAWEALLTVFELSTMEDWPAYMYYAIDAQHDPQAPKRDANPQNAIFFVVFIVIGAMFTLNLVVSAIVNHYLAFKEKSEGRGLTLSEEQFRWVQTMRLMLRFRPERRPVPPTGPACIPWLRRARRKLFRLVTHTHFEVFISMCILLGVLIMMTNHHDSSKIYDDVTEFMNHSLGGIFLVEALLKMTALGVVGYFKSRWNVFDFIIVCSSCFSFTVIFVQNASGFSDVQVLRGFRGVRALRTLRMLRGARGVQTLLQTFVQSLPSLYNVGSLLFLIFFMFSVLGVQLFGDMQIEEQLHSRANFSTFGWAFFMLFRCCTGENWASIFHQCRNHSAWAVPYFVAFLLISSWLMVNLWIAVILDNFDEAQGEEDIPLTRTDYALFAKHWATYDPDALEVIRTEDLPRLLMDLGNETALGFRVEGQAQRSSLVFMDVVMNLNIPDHDGLVHYYEVLEPLAYRLIGAPLPESENMIISKLVEKRFPKMKSMPVPGAKFYEVIAASRIQKVWRGHIVRKRLNMSLCKSIKQTFMVLSTQSPMSSTNVFASDCEDPVQAVECGIASTSATPPPPPAASSEALCKNATRQDSAIWGVLKNLSGAIGSYIVDGRTHRVSQNAVFPAQAVSIKGESNSKKAVSMNEMESSMSIQMEAPSQSIAHEAEIPDNVNSTSGVKDNLNAHLIPREAAEAPSTGELTSCIPLDSTSPATAPMNRLPPLLMAKPLSNGDHATLVGQGTPLGSSQALGSSSSSSLNRGPSKSSDC